jgi:O-antigen/teichoic acid export membrane protein
MSISIKRNIAANYVGQLYMTLAAILVVPLYINYMGAEAYGLVGFHAMLQSWFMLLDIGLSPTMARETARYRGGVTSAQTLRRLLRVLEVFFSIVGAAGAALLVIFAPLVAARWLNVEQLPVEEVERALMLIAPTIALRWVCGVYRSVINGFEAILWLNGANALIASLRFIAVVPFLAYVSATPTAFFAYQLCIAVLELALLWGRTYQLLPKVAAQATAQADAEASAHSLRPLLKFSLAIALSNSAWIVATQSDKLLLSKMLSLQEYGYFTLALLAANAVSLVNSPINSALLPRLSKLVAESNDDALLQLYRRASQLTAAITAAVGLTLICFAEPILLLWTSDPVVARNTAPTLSLYALGNVFLAFNAFPYFLQYAHGRLRLHQLGSVLFLCLLVPSVIGLAFTYGIRGAGYAWVITNALYFLFYVPYVHRSFVPSLHTSWLLRDILPIFILPTIAATLLSAVHPVALSRLLSLLLLGTEGLLLLTLSTLSSPFLRDTLRARIKRFQSSSST